MSELVIPCPSWKELKPWIYRILGLLFVIYLAYLVREIWLPLSIAFLLALVLDPVVDRLEHRGWSRTWGAALIFGGFILALGGVLYLGIPPMIDQASGIQERISKVLPDQSPEGIDKALKKQGAAPWARALAKAAIEGTQGSLEKTSSVFSTRIIGYLSNLIWVVIVPIVAFYALRDFHIILAKGLLLVRRDKRDLVQTAVTEVTSIFAKYLRGLVIVSSLNGLATWLLLAVLGVPSSLVLGLIAGVLYSVPYIGALITVVLIAVVSFLAGGMNHMLIVLGASVILHQIIFDQIVTPRIVGGQVGLHPILAIIALLAGNALLGLLGMILAVPTAACIQIGVLSMIPKLRQPIEVVTADPKDSTAGLVSEMQEAQLKVDATEELHKTVSNAVDTIEGKVPKDDQRRIKILSRRKRRAAGTGH